MRHLLLLVSSLLLLQAAPKCTMAKGTGEAEVIKTNITEAKREATSRAKWDAIDKVLGTQTSVKSVTENFALLDEVITNDVQGFISDFKIINEADFGDAYQVEISGCVYPKAAEKALSVLSRDSSFTVMLLVDEKGKVKTACQFCEKLFVYPDKHEKNCKKNPSIDTSLKSESIAIKA